MADAGATRSRIGDRLATFYDLRASEYEPEDPEADLRFRKVLRAADLAPGARLLDVGAKWGRLGQRARELGLDIEYVGLELSDENVRKAAALGLDVRKADVSAGLPVGDAEFDCAACLEIVEHVVDPLGLLLELRRVLRPNGRLIVSVPNPYSWVEIYRELFRRPDSEGHIGSFPTPVMENVLNLAGLSLERRLGTSIRIPKTLRLIPTNSILARSRIFVARPSDRFVFAGRDLTSRIAGGVER